jgi:DNA-binding winged helix-turn-helix (wHTH) protein
MSRFSKIGEHIVINLDNQTIEYDGNVIYSFALDKLLFSLLEYFCENPNITLSKDQIYSNLHDNDDSFEDTSIKSLIFRLRHLESVKKYPEFADSIQTKPNGYIYTGSRIYEDNEVEEDATLARNASSDSDTSSDHEIIVDNLRKTANIFAEAFRVCEHGLAEEIKTNQTVVNQYGDNPVHIERVEHVDTINVLGSKDSVVTDESGKPYVPINPVRYDSVSRIIVIGSESIQLPVKLEPLSTLAPQELPYINALCEVYAEKLNKVVTPDTIDTLDTNLRRHYSEQRKAYYSAESIQRSMREVFADGEKQFDVLKSDAYDGISDTYLDDRYHTGYERLMAVLDKITNITLNKSSLINVIGLIGNLEKKGICHILVNDDVIKSWVNINE